MLQNFSYWLKRRIHKFPRLYDLVYRLVTLNLDFVLLTLGKARYPSSFGGLWTDRDDFHTLLAKKLWRNSLNSDEARQLERFSEEGFMILEKVVSAERIDQYLDELEKLRLEENTPLMVTSVELEHPIPYSDEVHKKYRSIRTVDDYFFLSSARNILFDPMVTHYLELLLDKPAVLTQSLNFLYGSQQGMHKDTAFVRVNSPMKLLGVWVALEDVEVGSGELIYFPGSHRWDDYLFSGHFKHYDKERDGADVLDHNYLWIYEEARKRGIKEQQFLAKKGDVLIWHADLAHGGANVVNDNATRRSLVGHFCPTNVKPLYSYYKPGQRKVFKDGERHYMSSYYRP